MASRPGAAPRVRRCLLLIAAAGYGKTTAIEPEPTDDHALFLTARQALDRVTADVRPGRWTSPSGAPASHVIVDDVDQLAAPEQAALTRSLAELPASVHLTLASRRPLARGARSLPGRTVMVREAGDLALGPEETARVLREEHGITAVERVDAVHSLTAGWPALVHLAGDAVAREEQVDLLAAMSDPGTVAATWLEDHVVAHLPRAAARLLDGAVHLGPVTGQLCEDLAEPLGMTSARQAREAFGWLTCTGLLVGRSHPAGGHGPEGYRPVPVLATVVDRRRPHDGSTSRRALCIAAAAWYAAHGEPLAAATMHDQTGDVAAVLALVEARSEEMLAAGGALVVAHLVESIPTAERSDRLQLVLGDARRMSGDVSGAIRALEPLVGAAETAGAWPAGLAWRRAMVSYMAGDFQTALQMCDAAAGSPTASAGSSPYDVVRLHACRAGALFMLGDGAASAASAARALLTADDSGDPRALAAGHIAAALSATGASREDHLRRAQVAAESAGDVAQLARVLVNQVDELLEEARYPEALVVGRRALRAAERGSPPGLRTIALNNLGEVLLCLGHYDDAALYFERSVLLSRRAGLNRAASGLTGLAEIARARGRPQQSRMGFEEAVELSRDLGETQVLVPALIGLSRVLLEGPDPDPDGARAVADEALVCATPDLRPRALVAQGWVALATGDLAHAQQYAVEALAAARKDRAPPALAGALELAAAATRDADQARSFLHEALALWQAAGAASATDRLHVLLGRLPGADSADRLAAREAGRRLAEAGVEMVDGESVLPSEGLRTPLQVYVLGGFEVRVAGRPVPLTAWRSRQARTLVKMLVARGGRPIPRGQVCETLWPDEEPARTAHRLSVLLSVVRAVLDPIRAFPADHYLRADLDGVSLDASHVRVDAVDLLRDAAHASRLAREGQEQRARELLEEVDAMYRGDAFDEEPYEEWADAFREEVRAARLSTLREAAQLSSRAGEHDHAVASLVRLLAADPYDEPAYALLVATLIGAGRHGEARRAFDRWTQAMLSIDAPPPDERVLRASPVPRDDVVDLTRPEMRRSRPAGSA